MVALAAFASLLAGASVVLASPFAPRSGNCKVSSANPDLPSGQTNVTVPSGQTLQKITLGVGVQNYTCTDAGTYTSAGAIADLFDVSCLNGTPKFANLTTVAYNAWNAVPASSCAANAVNHIVPQVGVFAQHYFQTSPSGSGTSPVFDARATSEKGNPNAFVLTSKAGSIPAPTGSQDVDWLQLVQVQGDLAKTLLRLYTKFGQPPASCTPGSELKSVKYTALYWLYA